MEREIVKWTIQELINNRPNIGFPDFQREPNVWDLTKRRKLIDSIFRGFDISPIYLYKKGEDGYDCIDGKQRLNAIYSFMGFNEGIEDANNNFKIRMRNEIYIDNDPFLANLEDKTYTDLDTVTEKPKFDNYNLHIILVDTPLVNDEELNLLFLRLQIALVLNSGEKLHAMSGDMRNFVFSDLPNGIKNHSFFNSIDIRYRRYAKEQIAAQIALNYFSLHERGEFARSRYVDLQLFFKEKRGSQPKDIELKNNIKGILDNISEFLEEGIGVIQNRAIAVTTFLYAAHLIENNEADKLTKFKSFLIDFVATLKWQVKEHHNLRAAEEYRSMLTGFQNYVTQAAGESYAIRNRHNFIKDYFEHYYESGEIKGDSQYNASHEKSAQEERSNIVFRQTALPDG